MPKPDDVLAEMSDDEWKDAFTKRAAAEFHARGWLGTHCQHRSESPQRENEPRGRIDIHVDLIDPTIPEDPAISESISELFDRLDQRPDLADKLREFLAS